MSDEEFQEMVGRLEKEAQAKPGAYKFKVFLLALLGYAYPVLILLALLALLALVGLPIYLIVSFSFRGWASKLVTKLILPLVGLIFLILRSLWVRIPRPNGLVLGRENAALLYQFMNRFRLKLKGPRIHTILLTGGCNASVVQIPLLGIFGWQKNYLILGLPLLQALSPEQFCGVLAHEFGHLSGAHSRFGRWIYRVRQTWNQLMESLEQEQHWSVFIFERFLRWYVPFFNGYAFVLARAQEYEADRIAARLVGKRIMADALIKTLISGAFLDSRFWPSVYKKADREVDPPASPFIRLQEDLSAWVETKDARRWLDRILRVKTSCRDTHPSLADRLAALKEEARLPVPVVETAAHQFLGKNLAELTDSLNQNWREDIDQSWRNRFQQVQEAEQRLSAIEKKAESEPLNPEEMWERAHLTEEFRDSYQALPFYQNVLAANAEHGGGEFCSRAIDA